MYVYPITVEFEDIDSYGIIHHPKILYYFERARVHFFLDNNVDITNLPFGIVLRNINIQFKRQLYFLDKINIELTAKNIDKYRFDLHYNVKKDNLTANIAAIEMVSIDLATKKLAPIPDEFRKILSTIEN